MAHKSVRGLSQSAGATLNDLLVEGGQLAVMISVAVGWSHIPLRTTQMTSLPLTS